MVVTAHISVTALLVENEATLRVTILTLDHRSEDTGDKSRNRLGIGEAPNAVSKRVCFVSHEQRRIWLKS